MAVNEFVNDNKGDTIKAITINYKPRDPANSTEVTISFKEEGLGMPGFGAIFTTTGRLESIVDSSQVVGEGEIEVKNKDGRFEGAFLKLDKLKSFLEDIGRSNLAKKSFIDDVISHVEGLSTKKSHVASLSKPLSGGSKERLH